MAKARIVPLPSGDPGPAFFDPIVRHLREGGVLAYPTETVYGFGCALRESALAQVVRMKRRDAEKPLLLLIAHRDDAKGLAWTAEARRLADAFWPGPLTLVLADPEHRYPDAVRSGSGGVAVRATPHPTMRRLLEALGEPITSTSANVPGQPPALSAEGAYRAGSELLEEEEEESEDLLLVLGAETLPPSSASTIVDCSGPSPVLRRAGVIPLHALRALIPELDEREFGSAP